MQISAGSKTASAQHSHVQEATWKRGARALRPRLTPVLKVLFSGPQLTEIRAICLCTASVLPRLLGLTRLELAQSQARGMHRPHVLSQLGAAALTVAHCALCGALCESVLLSCSEGVLPVCPESVLLSCSDSPSWPSQSRCRAFVAAHTGACRRTMHRVYQSNQCESLFEYESVSIHQRHGISTGVASSVSSSRTATLNPSRKATQTRTVRETKHRRLNKFRRNPAKRHRVRYNRDAAAASRPAWPAQHRVCRLRALTGRAERWRFR